MKLKKYLSIFAIAVVAGFALAGCGKDDEPNGGNGNGNGGTVVPPGGEGGNGGGGTVVANPAIFDFGGHRLTRRYQGDYDYGWNYTYNEAGLLTSMFGNYDTYTISYTEGTITYIENGGYQEVTNFTTNKNGYITSLSSSGYESDDEDGDYIWQDNVTFTYDSSDRLIQAQASYKETSTSGAVIYISKDNWKLTWTNDLITKLDCDWSETDNDGTETMLSKATIIYGNNYPNIYRQFTYRMIEIFDIYGCVGDLMYVNMFGPASSQLPIRIIDAVTFTESDGTVSSHTYTRDLSYEMNSYGLVAKETSTEISEYGTTYTYNTYYDYSSSGFNAPAKRMNDAGKQPKERVGRKVSLRKARHAHRH